MTAKGFSLSDLDTTVSPGEDFFNYAVGGWLRKNPIPADYSRWGTFELLVEDSYEALREIFEHPETFVESELRALAEKSSQFYRAAMAEAEIEAAGITPLKTELNRIERVDSKKSLAEEIAHIHQFSANPLFGFYATPDATNSAITIAGLGQGGLGLPDRDYYLLAEERYKETREKYRAHIVNIFKLLGEGEAVARRASQDIFSIEQALAEISYTREELRDPVKNYNKLTFAELLALAPDFDWEQYFLTLGIPDVGVVDVGQVPFFRGLGDIINKFDFSVWRAYLTWNVTRSLAPTLSSAFVNERFAFYGQYLNGQPELKPRWKRAVDATSASLGKAVGRLYVAQNFSEVAKARARQLVQSLIKVMGRRIERVSWMGAETKTEALQKLAALKVKIGYPDQWVDYAALEVKSDSYAANVIRAHYFEFIRQLKKINQPTDTTEWLMDPQDVNAYYDQSRNEIVFPAAILQPPFFSDSADDALNFGAIGGVIGHEITHGFDDQGRQYDAAGNLRDWWTPDDAKRFQAQASLLVEQYNRYAAIDDLRVNGEFTLGENIADLGGLSVAYEALQDKLAETPQAIIDGLTAAERFFLSWAQSWKQNVRPELARLYVVVDPHSPPKFRVNGPVSNVPEFYDAFHISAGMVMYRPPESRVGIW